MSFFLDQHQQIGSFPREIGGGRVVRRCCVYYITGASN